MNNNQEILSGGREGRIIKEGNKVIRPSNIWTLYIHEFLNFLIYNDFNNVPIPYGINSDEEVLSFVPGKVYNYPLPSLLIQDNMLISVGKLLKKYHKISSKYISYLTNNEKWMLPIIEPIEVMCHGDFAPYNVTIMDGIPFGIIDFDTLHPGPKLWDVAYAVYRWVPFVSPENPDCYSNLKEQIRKAKVFADAYGLQELDRKKLPKVMVQRLNTLVDYMNEQACKGNEDFEKNINDGHMNLYIEDIKYITTNKDQIINGISNTIK